MAANPFGVELGLFCIVLIGASVLARAESTNEPNTKYVQASRLAFRAAPGTVSATLDHLPTNSPVQVLREQDGWCEVRPSGRDRVGFVSCNYIADVMVSIEVVQGELGQKNISQTRKLELLQKQFWIKPSVAHLMAYGALLSSSLLTEDHQRKEFEQARILRPARPEFEAMKRKLRDGWEFTSRELPGFDGSEPKTGFKSLLPVISTSLFKSRDVRLLLSPYIGNYGGNRNRVFMAEDTHTGDFSEILGAAVPGKSRVLEFGAPVQAKYSDAYFGSWDVFGAKVELPNGGVPFIGLVSDGKSIQGVIRSWSSIGVMPDAECDQIGNVLELSDTVPEPITKAGVFAFVLNPAQFNISSAKRVFFKNYNVMDSVALWSEFRGALSEWTSDSVGFVSAFDLDADNIADVLFVGAVSGNNYLSAGPALQRAFDAYINVLGEWVRYGRFSALECAS